MPVAGIACRRSRGPDLSTARRHRALGAARFAGSVQQLLLSFCALAHYGGIPYETTITFMSSLSGTIARRARSDCGSKSQSPLESWGYVPQ
jgi:hypothetical protein